MMTHDELKLLNELEHNLTYKRAFTLSEETKQALNKLLTQASKEMVRPMSVEEADKLRNPYRERLFAYLNTNPNSPGRWYYLTPHDISILNKLNENSRH